MKLLVIALSAALLSLNAHATDREREQRLAEEMEANLFDGDVIYLNDGEHDFVAAQIEADDAKGTVILLHGRGFHPDWQDVVGPVRVALAEEGWNTLSVQMPILEKGSSYLQYVPLFPASYKRIEAAIQHVRDNFTGPLVLFAHSCGAHMAMNWIDDNGDSKIDAYVGAGMGATDYGEEMIRPFPLDRMTVPILDVLGTNEYPRVLYQAQERKVILDSMAANGSAQVFVEGADHYFKDKNDELAVNVIEWLDGLQF